jgi:hypothetical protein
MANAQYPLIFFSPLLGSDARAAGELLAAGSTTVPVAPLDAERVLNLLRGKRGFRHLKVALPQFALDNPRIEASLEGSAHATHLAVQFYGNFEKLAEPLFKAFLGLGSCAIRFGISRSWSRGRSGKS